MREIGRETRKGDKKRVSNRKDGRKENRKEDSGGREKKKGIVKVRINEGRSEKERRGEKEMILEQAENNKKKKIIFHMDYSLLLSL